MSHKATHWLASLDPTDMTHGEFRVLFHLCDCHNPSQGCFPSQVYRKKIAPGYVFVCVDHQIAWDVLRQQSNGKVLGVVGRDGRPMPVPEDQMRAMKRLPKTIQKIYAEQEAASAIVPGVKARIKDDSGVMAGWVVDVSEVNRGIAKVLVPLFGGRSAKLEISCLEKVHRNSGK